MRNDFAVFIITHGRPESQLTYNTLLSCGYTGKVYFVLDDTDITIQQYIDTFGTDKIFVFNKNHYINSDEYDNGTNEGIYACAVYARRAVEDIAKQLKLPYFCLADDDILSLCIRYPVNDVVKRYKIQNLDTVFCAYLSLLENEKFSCVGFGRPDLYFTGDVCFVSDLRHLPFQIFIRKTSIPIKWACWYGEDEIAGYQSNTIGNLWIVLPYIMSAIAPISTGAMQSTYTTYNSYIRSFAELRYRPADFIIDIVRKGKHTGEYKLRRKTSMWFPKIVSSKYQKI